MSSLSRRNNFRSFVIVLLIALLFGAIVLHTGNLPALLADIFVFLCLLTISGCPLNEASIAPFAGNAGKPAPARAPPSSF